MTGRHGPRHDVLKLRLVALENFIAFPSFESFITVLLLTVSS